MKAERGASLRLFAIVDKGKVLLNLNAGQGKSLRSFAARQAEDFVELECWEMCKCALESSRFEVNPEHGFLDLQVKFVDLTRQSAPTPGSFTEEKTF